MSLVVQDKSSARVDGRRLLRRRAALALALLAVLGILSLWKYKSSQRTWEEYKAGLVSKGELIDWQDYVRVKMPAESENFGATPLLRRSGRRGQNDPEFFSRVTATKLESQLGETGNWTVGHPANLAAIQVYLRTNRFLAMPASARQPAEDILAALNLIEPELQELREAAQRPFAKLELSYPDPITADTPNFVLLRTLAQACSLHASAELRLRQADRAFEDVQVIYRRADLAGQEPTLVSAMICTALHGLALQAFWEGWISDSWSDQHLADFQKRLTGVDLLATMDRAVRSGERAGINYVMEHCPRDKLAGVFVIGTPFGWWDTCRRLLIEFGIRYSPRSWRYKNLLFYNRLLDETVFRSIDVQRQRVFPTRCQESAVKLDKLYAGTTPFNLLATVATPNFKRAFVTVTRNQTSINEALLVCALEQYRHQRGQYPSSLEALSPDFLSKLPHDILTGQPLKYRRTDDGKFLLYSVGWNEKDDDGNPDPENGDWVWPNQVAEIGP